MYKIEVSPHPKWQTLLKFRLAPGDTTQMIATLKERVLEDSSEAVIRLQDPRNDDWTIFFKMKQDLAESRIMVAHPERTQWVATLLLNEDHFSAFLKSLETQQAFDVASLGPVSDFCNLNVEFQFQG